MEKLDPMTELYAFFLEIGRMGAERLPSLAS